jgi:hypothetical protein
MRLARVSVLAATAALLCFGAIPLLHHILADSKPAVHLNAEKAAPREVDDAVQQAIARDYAAAWQALASAVNVNDPRALNENFVGLALDKLTQRIRDQRSFGLKTRILDRGHKVDAVFYSVDGSAIELKDTANIETQILEGNTVIHSDRAEIVYYAVMTGAEDHWKVRVLDSAKGD